MEIDKDTYEANLAVRISWLLDELEGRNDPRYEELKLVMKKAGTWSNAIHAAFSHIETRHHDLYGMVQRSYPGLEENPWIYYTDT